jgi:uncharacterized lipoprotein YajG
MKHLALLAAALLAAGCAQQQPSRPDLNPPPSAGGACDAAPAQFAVGQAQTAPLVEEVRQRSGSYIARVLRPGQVVTMEFNAQRVNVVVDADNRVTAVRCG